MDAKPEMNQKMIGKPEETLSEENFDVLMRNLNKLYLQLNQAMPHSLEKQQTLVNVTQAGMWLRMAFDMESVGSPEVMALLHNKEPENARNPDGTPAAVTSSEEAVTDGQAQTH